jgi:hypothetical protein
MASRELGEAIEVRSPSVNDHAIRSAHVGTRGAAVWRRRRLRLRLDLSIRPRWTDDGQGASIPPDAHFELNQPGEGFLSVHLNIGNKRAQSWLRRQPAIPETARYMFAHVGEHQHIEQSDSVIWGAIFDFVRDIGGATENLGHLRFALGERFLVIPLQSADATRRESNRAVESMRRRRCLRPSSSGSSMR